MITIETQISGGQIGSKLADDPEETWYALINLVDYATSDFAEEVQEHAHGLGADRVADFLEALATKIRNRE